MKTNMGSIDKAVRISIVVLMAVLYFTGVLSGTVALVLGILAAVFVITSFLGFCPLYWPLGINTCKTKKQ